MRYESSTTLRGDASPALEFAVIVLTGLGFRIDSRTAEVVELTGPGMNNTRQSPLRGASSIRLQAALGRMKLEADLGGVESMGRFLFWFPTLLCFGIGIVLSLVFLNLFGPGHWFYVVVALVAAEGIAWNFLGPFIARRIEARTRSELDTLLANAASMSAPIS